MRRRGPHPLNVGVAALVVGFSLIWLGFTKELPWHTDHELGLAFQTAAEIRTGSPVRVAGVNVGEVKGVERGPGSTAIVRVDMEEEALPVKRDASAKIRPRIFLEGNFFIDLRTGTPDAPELPEGGTIPVSQTATPVQLDQVLTALQGDERKRLRVALDELRAAGGGKAPQAFNRMLPALDPALRGVAVSAESFMGREPRDLSRAIRAQGRVAAALERNRPQLSSLVRSFARTAAALADRQRELGRSIAGLARVVREAGPALDAVTASVPDTRALIAEVRPGLREAPATLDAAIPLLSEVEGLLGRRELPALVTAARPAVADLASFAPQGTRLLSTLRAPVGCLLDNAVPTLLSPVEDPPHTTGAPAYRELLYGIVGMASGSQNFDGNGFNLRYHAGAGDQVFSTGEVPTAGGALFGTQAEPLIGSRPKFTGKPPPLEPTGPCTEQSPPDLRAETGNPGFQRTGARATPPPLIRRGGKPDEVLRRLARAGEEGRRRLGADAASGRLDDRSDERRGGSGR